MSKINRMNVATLCYLWIEEKKEVVIMEDEYNEKSFKNKYEAIDSEYGDLFVSSYWIKNETLYIFLA